MAVRYPLCSLNLATLANWLSHIRLVHSSDSSFAISCGIDQCSRTFKTFSAFNSHVYRNHRTAVMPVSEAITTPSHFQISEDNMCGESSTVVNNALVEDLLEVRHLLDLDKEDQEIASAKFILKLKEGRNMSQAAVDDVVDECQALVEHLISRLKAGVNERLSQSGINHEDVSGLDLFFDEVQEPFANLKTLYRQEKTFEKYFGYYVS